jgi:hypothetical protein
MPQTGCTVRRSARPEQPAPSLQPPGPRPQAPGPPARSARSPAGQSASSRRARPAAPPAAPCRCRAQHAPPGGRRQAAGRASAPSAALPQTRSPRRVARQSGAAQLPGGQLAPGGGGGGCLLPPGPHLQVEGLAAAGGVPEGHEGLERPEPLARLSGRALQVQHLRQGCDSASVMGGRAGWGVERSNACPLPSRREKACTGSGVQCCAVADGSAGPAGWLMWMAPHLEDADQHSCVRLLIAMGAAK